MSYKLTQTGQEVQALLNQIKNGGQSQVTDAVLYTEQALNDKEKEQARKNIGAAAENQIPTGAVLYSQKQDLESNQQAQARTNIGAVGTEQIPTALPQQTGAIQSGVLPTTGWDTLDEGGHEGWKVNTLPTDETNWQSVTYGNDKFVAVAQGSAEGAYSIDGINWIPMSMLDDAMAWSSVTYGNDKFVAVARFDAGAYSTDGITWIPMSIPDSRSWQSVTYGNNKFVAVARGSAGAYSTDGITWTETTLPVDQDWDSVTYGNGKYVAVGWYGGAYSTDGITWAEMTMPESRRWTSVTYGGGKFVAVAARPAQSGVYQTNKGAYSVDGRTWTEMTLPTYQHWSSVTYGGGKFVAVADNYADKGAYSVDGRTWTEMALPTGQCWNSVTYGNGKFVAIDRVHAYCAYWDVSDAQLAYTISNTSITANSDILMEITDKGVIQAYTLANGSIKVIRNTVPTQPIPYTYKVKQTNASGQFTLVNHYVPKKVSELENDVGYTANKSTVISGDFTWPDPVNLTTTFCGTEGLPNRIIDSSSFAQNIWTDGETVYCSYRQWRYTYTYALDKRTFSWFLESENGNNAKGTWIGQDVWTDGTNTYLTSADSSEAYSYVWNKTTRSWKQKTWQGATNIAGAEIWHANGEIYFASSYYLTKDADGHFTDTWAPKTWNGLTDFGGIGVWTDGTDTYYSDSNGSYVLNASTSTWTPKTWEGLTTVLGDRVWTDGTAVYYSDVNKHYVLNKEAQRWEPKQWDGIDYFSGIDIWTDGEFVYCTPSYQSYVLNNVTGGWSPKNSSALNTSSWEPDEELDPTHKYNIVSIVRDVSNVSGWGLSAPRYLLVVNIDNEQHSFVSLYKNTDTSDPSNPKTGLYFDTFGTDFQAVFMTSGGSLANPKQVKCAIAVPPGAQNITLVGLYPAAQSEKIDTTPLKKNSDIVVYVEAEQELWALLTSDNDSQEPQYITFTVHPNNPPAKLTGKVKYSVMILDTPGEGRISTIQGGVEDETVVAQLSPKVLPQSASAIQTGKLDSAQWSLSLRNEWDITALNSEMIDIGDIISWGKDKFVAIGTIQGYKGLLYSYDGVTWQLSDAPSEIYGYNNIIYDGTRFIATYTSNGNTRGLYSLDGISWTAFTNFTNIPGAERKTLCYGNGKYVISTQYQSSSVPYKVWYSVDGETWVEGHINTNASSYDSIIYGNGVFVGVSTPSCIDYSTDGENWFASTRPVDSINFNAMAYENGRFVLLPDSTLDEENYTRVAYVSTDGKTWTEMTMPNGASSWNNGGWQAIAGGDGLFVAMTEKYITTSTDGIHWSPRCNAPSAARYVDRNIAYGGQRFIIPCSKTVLVGHYEAASPGMLYWGRHLHNTYTIEDENVLHDSDVLFEISDPCKITSCGVEAGKIILACDERPTHDISYRYKATHTDQKGQLTVINHYIPDSSSFVSVEKQTLTEVQQAQVRQNIGAGVSNFSGDYNDLINAPTIPTKVSELENDSGFTDNIGTITQIKINGEVKEPKPSGLIDLGHITPEPTDWTTVPITTALENGKTYVVKLDTTPYPLTAIFTMSEALDAIDANVVGGTQQGTDGASTYELQSATITVKDGKLTGLKSTNLVSNANPGAANLAYSESTFADLGITQYHYIELLNSVGGGMSGKGVNYTAIKDTLAIDKWTTDEIHVEGEILPTTETVLVTFDNTVQHTIDKTKENTLLIGHATADELTNIGYWAFDGQSLVVNVISSTDPDTNAPLRVLFSETTDTYFKYLYQESNTTLATLYVYKSNFNTYTTGDIVLVLSADVTSGIDWIKCSTLTPSSELEGMSAVNFYGYTFPSDLTGASITIDVLCTKTDSPDIRKTLLMPYVGAEEIEGNKLHIYIYQPTTEEEAQAFPMAFMAYVLTSNIPEVAPAGTIIVFGGDQSSGSDPKYVFSKLFSLTTAGMAPVTYTYLNENIKLESAIKVYLNDSENIQIIDRQEGYVQFKRAKVADIPFSMEILDTEEEGLLRLFNSYKEPIPTKLSQFQNDTEYLTNDDIHVTSPIMKGGSLDGKPDLWLQSSYNTSFAQYSSGVKTGTLKVDSWVEKSGYYVYTIEDYSIFNYNTDVLMTVNSPVMLEASDLTASKLELKAKSKPTEPIPYSYKLLATKEKGQFTIVNGYIPTMPVVPTKTSELENDSNFVTSADIPTKTSQLTNDSNFAVAADIPTKTSELQNDSGYVTAAEVEDVQRIEAWKHSDSDKKATLTKAGTYQTFGEFPITENDSTINYKWYGEIYFDGTSATIGTSSNYNKFNSQTSQLTMVTATPTITADENGKMLLRVEILNYRIGESPVTAATDYIAFKYRKITNEDAVERQKIYGVDLVGSENPSALVRTDDAVGLNVIVHTSEITSDFDNCYPWSAIEEVTDDAGNVFIKIPKFYSKITKNADGTCKHQLSGKKHDGFSTLFVDGAGNEIDYVLVGKYEGSGTAERVYSKSGATVLREITLDNFRAACRANGAGYQQYDFLIDLIIKELWLVEMKTTNSQSIMYGYANDNPALITTGKTDTVKTSSGSPISNTDGKHAMKYRGIENLWGNTVLWCDGISFSNNKVYVCTDPASYTAGKIDAPYVYQGDRAASYGYVKKVEPLGQNPLIQYVTEVGGSLTTYFCDAVEVNHSPSAPATALTVGGGLGITTNAGLWNWKGQYPLNANSYIGGRLCYKPSQST